MLKIEAIKEDKKDLVCRCIRHTLKKLSRRDRTIFMLKHYKDISEREISQRLNLPDGEIKRSLRDSSHLILRNLQSIKDSVYPE